MAARVVVAFAAAAGRLVGGRSYRAEGYRAAVLGGRCRIVRRGTLPVQLFVKLLLTEVSSDPVPCM